MNPKALATYPPADITVERITDLSQYDLRALLPFDRAGGIKTTSEPILGGKS